VSFGSGAEHANGAIGFGLKSINNVFRYLKGIIDIGIFSLYREIRGTTDD
jgi:hypothetical protein